MLASTSHSFRVLPIHTPPQVCSQTHRPRRLSVKMSDKMQERFGAFMDPQNDESAYGSAEEPLFGSRYTSHDMPKYEFPKKSMQPAVAAQLVRNMHQLDANPRLDMASFVTTWMDPEATALIAETQAVNIVDTSQYPQCTEMEQRCIQMLAGLWNAPESGKTEGEQRLGTSTIGSSEACMLGGLALKRRWSVARKKAGKSTDKPNLILGINAQVCWEKFNQYFEVEGRYVPVEVDYPVMSVDRIEQYADENTIGVISMFGSTYNGQYEDVKAFNDKVAELNKKNGWDMRIHVDAASGGFVAPFVYPDLEFDFRLPLVNSVSASGHKYGLVYPGVGWIIWRNRSCVDESLIFHVNYLGTDQPSLNLNFSKNANMIVAQYYQFLRLGFEGYKKIMTNLMEVSAHLAKGILATGHFDLIGGGKGLPVVAFALKPNRKNKDGDELNYDEFDIMDRMKEFHWQLPAYNLPKNAEKQKMLRCVVREDLSYEMATDLINDMNKCIEWLDHHFIYSEEKVKSLRQHYRPKDHPKHHHIGNKKHQSVC